MKLSERLLQLFDAKAAAERAQVQAQAADVDALGEILSTAHYAGIDCRPEQIHAHGESIMVCNADPEATIAWMLSAGFSVEQVKSRLYFTHNHLRHPSITCPIVILTDKGGAERA